jgi:putative ABC transport system ATP-binding protein
MCLTPARKSLTPASCYPSNKKGDVIMATLLEAKEVTKFYGKSEHPSLNKVSFRVAEGEFIGIMGASGSGKTTLLNVLSTIDTPTSGNIWIKNVNLKSLNHTSAADFRRDNLGFIFQEYFLLDSLTIRENIAVPLTLQKLPPKKIENMVRSLAERFGIASQLGKYPGELSGGQRQRASAARAIVKKPGILFADEPTGALDSSSATELLNTLYEANRELQTTILMVTHDAYAASFTKRILIFKDGCIIKELMNHGNNRREFYESITAEITKLDSAR